MEPQWAPPVYDPYAGMPPLTPPMQMIRMFAHHPYRPPHDQISWPAAVHQPVQDDTIDSPSMEDQSPEGRRTEGQTEGPASPDRVEKTSPPTQDKVASGSDHSGSGGAEQHREQVE